MSAEPSDPVGSDSRDLTRRWMLRGGVVATGAAVVAAMTPSAAMAADGDQVVLGGDNDASSATTIGIGGGAGSTDPALSLVNADGPSLHLEALAADYAAALELGQIANTVLGPLVGVDTLSGLSTTFLVTGIDLADLPTPHPLATPKRILDTRTSSGRSRVIRTSPGAYDSTFRLKAGAWLDVEVVVEGGDVIVPGAHLNVTSTGATSGGFLSVYPPGDFPGTSTVNYPGKMTIANGTFVGTGVVLGRYAVRVRASAPSHVVLDLTAVTIKGSAPEPAAQQAARSSRRARISHRLRSRLSERLQDLLAR
ncbi:hypothetical protein [Microlunatus ginsengisoli]|uniref:Uncharacterized protein n=1 Tax=Microlunatus ginsengisoli TaxID=363863 RepID=A0ABP7A9P7_9ACTN